MSTDIFSKNFRPYVKYTKGHYAYDVYKKKRVYIKGHYSYCDRYSVSTINFKDKADRIKFYKAKSQGRVFYK